MPKEGYCLKTPALQVGEVMIYMYDEICMRYIQMMKSNEEIIFL